MFEFNRFFSLSNWKSLGRSKNIFSGCGPERPGEKTWFVRKNVGYFNFYRKLKRFQTQLFYNKIFLTVPTLVMVIQPSNLKLKL